MSRLGTKTYSRKQECKTSLQFDHLLSDKGNKPSTAKVSVAAVHRWGMTSFTSLRKTHLNGQKDISIERTEAPKRIKLEPKLPPPSLDDPFNFDSETDVIKATSQPPSVTRTDTSATSKSTCSKPNKFFKSGGTRLLLSSSASAPKSDFDALKLSVNRCGVQRTDNEKNYGDHFPSRNLAPLVESSKTADTVYTGIVQSRQIVSAPATRASSTVSADNEPDTKLYSVTQDNENILCKKLCSDFDKLQADSDSLWDQLTRGTDKRPQSTLGSEKLYAITDSNAETSTHWTHTDETIPIDIRSNDSLDDDISIIEETKPVEKSNRTQAFPSLSECENWNIQPTESETTLRFVSKKEIPDISEDSHKSNDKSSSDSSPKKDFPSSVKEKKQRHLFRSRRIFNSPKKHKAVYNHRHWHASDDEDDDEESQSKNAESQAKSLADEFEDEELETVEPVLIREESVKPCGETVAAVKCPRKVKELYTVIKNVKQAYQCHESGETQEFNDDVEYLLESVQPSASIGPRCLGVLSLATKCMGPSFRIHLRAHGTITKIFSALQDAPLDPNLSLCTATLMFVLSQDRLTMDLEASTLSLMLQLLETGPQERSGELESDNSNLSSNANFSSLSSTHQEKHKEKVYQLCEQMQQKGHAKHLNLKNINTGNLAMETLLSLTSRRAGEWFKEELRNLHGLDHIVDTVNICVNSLEADDALVMKHPTTVELDMIQKIDRCLRVLENVTYLNQENKTYLLEYRNSMLVTSCISMLQLCRRTLMHRVNFQNGGSADAVTSKSGNTPASVIFACLLSLLKVLLNITHENARASHLVCSYNGLVECVLLCILQTPRAVVAEDRFELLVLSVELLITLMECSKEYREQLVEMQITGAYDSVHDGVEISALEALAEVLLLKLEAARQSEEQADELLSSQEKRNEEQEKKKNNDNNEVAPSSHAEALEETLMKALQKAGKHMEHTIIAAYIALLLGYVIEDNQVYGDLLRDHMPDGNFNVMIQVLRKFLSFVSLTGVGGQTGGKSIQRLIDILESS